LADKYGFKASAASAEFRQYLAVPHMTLYTNGHLALKNVITAMDMPDGNEVITTWICLYGSCYYTQWTNSRIL